MGVDVTATMDHALPHTAVLELPERITAALAALPDPVDGKPIGYWAWKLDPAYCGPIDELERADHISLGSRNFSATVLHHGIELGHPTRWYTFLVDTSVRASIRSVALNLARTLGSSRIIYLPDSASESSAATDTMWDGGPIEDVEAWLRSHLGPPFLGDQLIPGLNRADRVATDADLDVWLADHLAGG